MLYQFGPDKAIVKAIGQSKFPSGQPDSIFPAWIPAFSSHFWVMILLAVIVGYVLNRKPWGKHLYAIGGNEPAARMTGVNVDRIKFQAYVFSAFCASVASLLILGYSGSAINALGQSYELRVIAATVIGGANLLGGSGTAYGAIIGSALLEVIRNALLMAGIDSNWQGAFVGAFIILAVLIGMETRGFSLDRAAPQPAPIREGPLEDHRQNVRLQSTREDYLEETTDDLGDRLRGDDHRLDRLRPEHLRAGAEEHEQPVLRPGPRRLQEGRGGVRAASSPASTSAPASTAAATSRCRSSRTSSPAAT